jgi:hypothetical protein
MGNGSTLSDLPTGTDDGSDSGPVGEASSCPGSKRPWLGRLSTYIVSFAGGLTIDDLGGRLGYRWLAGAVALLGVVTAAVWVRGLDSRARVARYVPPLFLLPAGCAAGIAAFNSGSTAGIFTAAAAVLTVGAVWVTKELQSAARLLFGAVAIALGAPVFVLGAAFIADRAMLARAAFIASGATVIVFGAVLIADRRVPAGAAAIAVGAAFIVDRAMLAGAAVIAVGTAFIGFGVALIWVGAAFIAHPAMLFGAAVITLGAALIAFQGSVHRVRASGHSRP